MGQLSKALDVVQLGLAAGQQQHLTTRAGHDPPVESMIASRKTARMQLPNPAPSTGQLSPTRPVGIA